MASCRIGLNGGAVATFGLVRNPYQAKFTPDFVPIKLEQHEKSGIK